ncbi:YbaK/prolyl-tRNA synthetase associated region [Candidatus Terasakiella magnetica]|uniref:YbaK/prolyl-tRNA synthetase associated region n=1 Tax=Candidatus Terasakiella magnetica TaxID=1867952 RepID=A0A1C3RGU3_9PROT|nr:YbaK/EbsC family protein [Candidatus Terasakiella magnetica]SCA56490.1 YbaK/prolyl-tRNA synthetase associated region [Candidatus Terasakiella magnetica]
MGISITLEQFLDTNSVSYDTLTHELTATASQTAEAAHIPGARLIKAVVVKADERFILALLPASHHLNLDMLKDTLLEPVTLAKEEEFTDFFKDCETGAVPALGMAYDMDVVVDSTIADVGDVMFEAGDHETLVRMQAEDFESLVHTATHGYFSRYDKHPEKRGGFRFSHS